MAVPLIESDPTKDPVRKIHRGALLVREGRDVLRDAKNALEMYKDTGDNGTQATHWARAVEEGLYPTTADALASWLELISLVGILNTPAGQQASDVGPAITNLAAKHGI
jgi:hypothetical protein